MLIFDGCNLRKKTKQHIWNAANGNANYVYTALPPNVSDTYNSLEIRVNVLCVPLLPSPSLDFSLF